MSKCEVIYARALSISSKAEYEIQLLGITIFQLDSEVIIYVFYYPQIFDKKQDLFGIFSILCFRDRFYRYDKWEATQFLRGNVIISPHFSRRKEIMARNVINILI